MLDDSTRDRPADGKYGSPAEEFIQVTPEMIEAGLVELREHSFSEGWGDILEDVFRAMSYKSRRVPLLPK